jgi:hypothetical protein
MSNKFFKPKTLLFSPFFPPHCDDRTLWNKIKTRVVRQKMKNKIFLLKVIVGFFAPLEQQLVSAVRKTERY